MYISCTKSTRKLVGFLLFFFPSEFDFTGRFKIYLVEAKCEVVRVADDAIFGKNDKMCTKDCNIRTFSWDTK